MKLINQEFTQKMVRLDGQDYDVLVRDLNKNEPETPCLIIAAYLPDRKAIDLLKICINSIQKFTASPYQLWVVDNNSPAKYLKWLLKNPKLNLIFNRTDPLGDKNQGSYRNSIQYELAAHFVAPETRYFMTLQQDTAICHANWLDFLKSKINDKVKIAGVRMDTARVKTGIVHSLGCMIDFQLFKKLGLSYYPQLPELDVGDRISTVFKEKGYQIFASPNTIWDKEYIDKIPADSPYSRLCVDRSFDEQDNIFFLHLGRGVIKAKQSFFNKKNNIKLWKKIIEKEILNF